MSLNYSASWAPQITAADLWFERGWLNGVFVGAVAYGVHATLFFITFQLLWERPRSSWRDFGWLAYIVVLFSVSSVGNATQLRICELGFLEYRNYPGPPAGWEAGNTVVILSNAVYIFNTWLQDGLLLYRFRIIVGGSPLWTILPALVYLATICVGCAIVVTLTQPGVVLWATVSANLLTAHFSLSVAYNLSLTLAIVGKLLTLRHRVKTSSASTGPYITVSAMLIESAALYSAFGIVLVVATIIKSSALQNLILPTLSQAQSIAPMLIIMRVAQGRACTTAADRMAAGVSSSAFRYTERDEVQRNTHPLSSLPTPPMSSASKAESLFWTGGTNYATQDLGGDATSTLNPSCIIPASDRAAVEFGDRHPLSMLGTPHNSSGGNPLPIADEDERYPDDEMYRSRQ